MKKFKNKLYRVTITGYYKEDKLYLVNYGDRDNKTMSYRQINKYKYVDYDEDTTRRITINSASPSKYSEREEEKSNQQHEVNYRHALQIQCMMMIQVRY